MRDLRNSRVLSNAKLLVHLVYEFTEGLPQRERFALTRQMQRAAVSVAANIAEGLGRASPGDLERHLRIASGSAAELEVLLELAGDIHRVSNPRLDDKVQHVRRQLNLLIQRVQMDR